MTSRWHEQRIRERAYQVWEETGRPEGKAIVHWLQAEAEIAGQERDLETQMELEQQGVV